MKPKPSDRIKEIILKTAPLHFTEEGISTNDILNAVIEYLDEQARPHNPT